ncbi:MAG: methyltransferase [Alphaproteobacteria bacterium]|nr:methyltransferase [Alphaproteobacteria bacterium]
MNDIPAPVLLIEANTVIATPPLVPEIRLHLATEVTPLWEATERFLREAHLPPPFWAFAWPGGQALARFVLDNPAWVEGRRVLDVGAGSGLVAIAAALAGAKYVIAADMDANARRAVLLNAALNGVDIEIVAGDATAQAPAPVDTVLAGDICYERGAAARLSEWLAGLTASGMVVLLGDPGRTYLPKDRLEALANYDVPTSLELEDRVMKATTIWRMRG